MCSSALSFELHISTKLQLCVPTSWASQTQHSTHHITSLSPAHTPTSLSLLTAPFYSSPSLKSQNDLHFFFLSPPLPHQTINLQFVWLFFPPDQLSEPSLVQGLIGDRLVAEDVCGFACFSPLDPLLSNLLSTRFICWESSSELLTLWFENTQWFAMVLQTQYEPTWSGIQDSPLSGFNQTSGLISQTPPPKADPVFQSSVTTDSSCSCLHSPLWGHP